MEESDYRFSKWFHPIAAGASFTYLLSVLDKFDLIAGNSLLQMVTLFFLIALVLNALWSAAYYSYNDKTIKSMNFFVRRCGSSAQWMFIIACVMLLFHVFTSVGIF